MAKTTRLVLTGTAQYAKIFEGNRDMDGYEGAYKEHGGAYTIDVVLDSDEYAKLRATDTMKKGVVVDDGVKVKFIRKHDLKFTLTDGTVIDNGGEPEMYGPDGEPWDIDKDGLIGNGSKVKVYLSVYSTSRKAIFGTRLEGVKVIDHVEFGGSGTPSGGINSWEDALESDGIPF